MHSVLLVDDEPFVRLSLASLGPWAAFGFDVAAEASNGEEALEALVRRPEIDIMLLDLSMPVMDGLETLRRLPTLLPRRPPATVVLSAHDDYPLVRQAFTLGAVDYLLKGELDATTLRAALDKAASGLDVQADRTAAILERRHLDCLKAQVLRTLLLAPASPDLEEAFRGLRIGIALPFVVCCLWIEELARVTARQGPEGLGPFTEMVARAIQQVLPRWGVGEVVTLAPGQFAVLFALREPSPGSLAAALHTTARAFCAEAAGSVSQYLSVKVTTAVGSPCAQIQDAPESLRAARSVRTVESRIVVLAKRAIHERYADPAFSLEAASECAGVSKNHLSFEFSRETGETFSEYLSRVRIDEAKRLLATTSQRVTRVGELVGYPNAEHFSRVFKKGVGVSPLQFKTGHGRDEPEAGP